MTNKTPFELRFDALELARDYLTQSYYAEMELIERRVAHGIEFTNGIFPDFPTPTSIIDLADRLRGFIDGKPQKEQSS
jgi:hypothetical protein